MARMISGVQRDSPYFYLGWKKFQGFYASAFQSEITILFRYPYQTITKQRELYDVVSSKQKYHINSSFNNTSPRQRLNIHLISKTDQQNLDTSLTLNKIPDRRHVASPCWKPGLKSFHQFVIFPCISHFPRTGKVQKPLKTCQWSDFKYQKESNSWLNSSYNVALWCYSRFHCCPMPHIRSGCAKPWHADKEVWWWVPTRFGRLTSFWAKECPLWLHKCKIKIILELDIVL